MGVTIPGYHLRTPRDLPEMRKRLKGHGRGKKHSEEELNLTSMIDVMSVVVLFLIQNFSATGEILIANKDIKLPSAYHGSIMKRAPIITVTAEKVSLEGLDAGDNAEIAQKIEETDWELPTLSKTLSDYKTFYETVAPGNGAIFPGEVIVQADNNLDFLYLKRVMFTLRKAGWGNIMLAVRANGTVGETISDTVDKAATQFNKNVNPTTAPQSSPPPPPPAE